jgi:hypothetical protein
MDSLIDDISEGLQNKCVIEEVVEVVVKTSIMDIIDEDDKNLLLNRRICNMSRIDWGKTMAISNQYIHRNILRKMLCKFGYEVYSTDDDDLPCSVKIRNNSPGFDLVIVTPNGKHLRIQSKLRQVKGTYAHSQQTHFETTRRNCEKNKDLNHTGHICYSLDEFDFVMISLINDREDRGIIKNCDAWTYCFIPLVDLEDKTHNCCVSKISPSILKKNVINIEDNIQKYFL